MLTRMMKMIGLGLAIIGTIFLFSSAPTLAKSPVPTFSQPLVAAAPAAANVTFDICAATGSVTMPDAATIPIWGFGQPTGTSPCASQLPGPVLTANVGDTVTINLTNIDVPEAVSLVFPGLNLLPDETGVSAGNSRSYTFTVNKPGTYLYESGVNYTRQVPMGLYGALMVRVGPNQAYSGGASTYNTEAVLVLSELDPNLNANPNGFNMLNYAPKYWLINGKAYPDTSNISAATGARVLLRYVNAALTHHTMSLLGMHQAIIARDAFELPSAVQAVAETIPAGQTIDAIATVPAGAAVGDKFPLYNRQLRLTNVAAFPGGMLTFIEATSIGGGTNNPPVATADGPYNVNQGANLNVATPGVLNNDNDGGDGPGPLTAVLVTGPANAASFTLNPNGSFSYTHNGSATTSDSFTYKANDGVADSNTVTVSLNIVPNVPPVATNDTGSVNNGAALTIAAPGVLSNDNDPDGSPSPITAVLVAGPTNASSFTLNPNGSYNYTHNGSATITDTFTYKANDGLADSNVATVNLTINSKHIGDLDRSATNPPIIGWFATVTIRVDNATHGPVSGASPAGTWSPAGTAVLNTCSTLGTGGGGTCFITQGFADSVASVTFTVNGITGAAAAGPYVPGLNHDPDSGAQASNGTTITVPRP